MNQATKALTEQEKNELIDKLRNFPTLPKDIQLLQGISQRKILYQHFPWGCKRLREENIQFNSQDQITHINYTSDYNLPNILIGVKYGICYSRRPEKLKELKQRLQRVQNNNANLYVILKLQQKPDQFFTMVLAKVNKVNLYTSFKFWSIPNGKLYPSGIVFIDVIAVGYINTDGLKLDEIFNVLRRSTIQWKYFRVAEDYELIERRKYIQAIKADKFQLKQKQLHDNNVSIMENSNMK